MIPRIAGTVLTVGSFNPAGDRFVFSRGDTVMTSDMEGVSRAVTIAMDPHSLVWSPDGRLIAYVSGNRDRLNRESSTATPPRARFRWYPPPAAHHSRWRRAEPIVTLPGEQPHPPVCLRS